MGLSSTEAKFEEASEIHRKLAEVLGAKKGFFDYF
jgi:hypothetical protein